MNYFKVLGILLGVWITLGGAWAAFFTGTLKQLFEKCYPETRPSWLLLVGGSFLALVIATWIAFAKAASMEHFVVTLVLSLGLLKVVPLVLYYKKSREFLNALMAEPLALRVIALSSAAVGSALLVMGLFF